MPQATLRTRNQPAADAIRLHALLAQQVTELDLARGHVDRYQLAALQLLAANTTTQAPMVAMPEPFSTGRHHKTGAALCYFHRRCDAIDWLIANDGCDFNQTSPASKCSSDGIWRVTTQTKEALHG